MITAQIMADLSFVYFFFKCIPVSIKCATFQNVCVAYKKKNGLK